jgi:Putative peptidoglycan binding domain
MNTKLFTGLALAAALLTAQPGFAATRKTVAHVASSGHAVSHVHVAAVHRVSHASVASARTVSHANVAAYHARTRATSSIAAAHNTRAVNSINTASHANLASRGNNTNYRRGGNNSVAFGGSGSNTGHRTYAFASHAGWTPGHQYNWHGHHYGWYGNAWFIIDPYPAGYGYYGPDYGYYNGGGSAPVSVQVQAALQQQGYYQGPVDGIVGPGTSAAIAAYQQANGLRVTGTITHGLLNNLGIG